MAGSGSGNARGLEVYCQSMSNLINISDYMPHVSGPAICTKCRHEWVYVAEKSAERDTLECPSCGLYYGVLAAPFIPETVWECDCGSQLYYCTPEGFMCRGCGEYHG